VPGLRIWLVLVSASAVLLLGAATHSPLFAPRVTVSFVELQDEVDVSSSPSAPARALGLGALRSN